MPYEDALQTGDTGRRRKPHILVVALIMGVGLSACSPAPQATGIYDPYEEDNRRVHESSKRFDRNILRPAASAYGNVVPEPVRLGVGNVVSNVDMPRMVVNNILQGNVEDAVHNTFRFLVNSTFGLAGLLDPATDMGLTPRETDFGETLYVWGAGEGAYLELPVIGPTTERDAVGTVIDLGLNPLRFAMTTAERDKLRALGVLDGVGDRYRFSDTIDSVLYDSADSYAQARLLYLQNRRFELSGSVEGTYEDPYEDPYFDPYEDPYAQ